jgi:hypothetical protein
MADPQAPPPGRVRWDGSKAVTAYANVFQLSADRAEITVSFGTRGARHGDELPMEVSDHVVVSPATAKRLVGLLSRAVRDYEWKHGDLGGDPLPAPAPFPGPRAGVKPPQLTVRMSERASQLHGLVDALGVKAVLERSIKMSEGRLLPDRFLWGFKRDFLASREPILRLCEHLGMPANFRADFGAGIGDANVLFLGIEESEQSCRYKAYLEFADRVAAARVERPGSTDPVLLYTGFKWDADDPTQAAVAGYTCYPGLTARGMVDRMAEAVYGGVTGPAFILARKIVEMAARRAGSGPDKYLYLETTEDGSSRLSFDINLYNAGLRVEEVYPVLVDMCRHFRISQELFLPVFTPIRTAAFGHITGGLDRDGREFLSIYFGGQPAPVSK